MYNYYPSLPGGSRGGCCAALLLEDRSESDNLKRSAAPYPDPRFLNHETLESPGKDCLQHTIWGNKGMVAFVGILPEVWERYAQPRRERKIPRKMENKPFRIERVPEYINVGWLGMTQ